ncbi:Multidrug resistance protein MdtH [uncultured archaeon]|nr:Multidrug resistance protein MdtH [uncultured archaeon]
MKKFLGVNKNIFLLGIVSFLTDLSSELIFSIFSVFVTVILGASVVLLGFIEGLADFASSSLDYIAGKISDRTGKRKSVTIFGYGFSTLAKLILVFQTTILSAFSFRIIERFGKSIRGPPRDAWIASLTNKNNRGYSFGLHKALDKAGAVLGPLVAYFVLMSLGQTASTFSLLFKIAFIPAILSVILLLFINSAPTKPQKRESIFAGLKNARQELKNYFYSAGIFSLAYFSFSFLLLKAYSVGFQIKEVVLLYALFNLAFVIFSAPLGKLGDKIGRRKIIASEYIIYLLMSLGFVFATSKLAVILLFVLFGIFYSIDEGQSKAYLTDMEKQRRATVIGLYNFVTGIIYIFASIIAGYLWSINPNYAFVFAAVISILALGVFLGKKRD